jgi:hypothetical protein
VSLEVAYIDGTKMESRANRYTFVWRKTVEKNKSKLEAKIRRVLEYIDEGISWAKIKHIFSNPNIIVLK